MPKENYLLGLACMLVFMFTFAYGIIKNEPTNERRLVLFGYFANNKLPRANGGGAYAPFAPPLATGLFCTLQTFSISGLTNSYKGLSKIDRLSRTLIFSVGEL